MSYVVTGVDVDGKRFRLRYGSMFYVFGINLLHGRFYLMESESC